MNIKIITYLLVVVFGIYFQYLRDTYKNLKFQKYYVVLICIILGLVSGLRGLSVGPDTITYYNWFLSVSDISWTDVFDNFYLTYIEGTERDPGFLLFVKFFQLFSNNWQLFLLTLAFLFYFTLGDFLYKITKSVTELIFAFVLYVSLFEIIALSGIRQQIAISITLWSLNYLKSKRWILYIIVIIIAAQFHITALIMLPFGFAVYLPKKYYTYIYYLSILSVPIVMLFGRSLVALLASFLANDYYTAYAVSANKAGAATYIFLAVSVAIIGLFTITNKRVSYNTRIIYTAIAFMTFLVPLTIIDGSLIRLGQYFSLYMMVFIPILINRLGIGSEYKPLVYLVLISILMYLTLRAPFIYKFFWQ